MAGKAHSSVLLLNASFRVKPYLLLTSTLSIRPQGSSRNPNGVYCWRALCEPSCLGILAVQSLPRVCAVRVARQVAQPVLCPSAPPRRLDVAMSIFFIDIIASKARLASAPPAASASVSARGVICQDRPQRSLHQPHWLSLPPLPTIGFQ
jgi:hypothetical protein